MATMTKRAQELAQELLRTEPTLSGYAAAQGHTYSGLGGNVKDWFMSKYQAHPKVFMIGGIGAAVVVISAIGFAAYRKKKMAEGQ